MPSPTVQTILTRAMTDAEFRKQLTTDKEAVFAQYPALTPEDKAELQKMQTEAVDPDSGDVDQRISKGSLSAWGG